MSISIGLWRMNLSVIGAVSSIARLLNGERCSTVIFMEFLTSTCYSFKTNRLIIDIKKPRQLRLWRFYLYTYYKLHYKFNIRSSLQTLPYDIYSLTVHYGLQVDKRMYLLLMIYIYSLFCIQVFL